MSSQLILLLSGANLNLLGQREPGKRKRSRPDPFEPFLKYVETRLKEDPHVWVLLPNPLGGQQSFVGLGRGHADVKNHERCALSS